MALSILTRLRLPQETIFNLFANQFGLESWKYSIYTQVQSTKTMVILFNQRDYLLKRNELVDNFGR